MRSKISSKLIFASCVWYSDRAYYELCVFIKDIDRRLPLQLQCTYQGQQGDVSQSVRGNYKTRFWGGPNLTAMKGNVSVYQVNPVSRITGEGRAEFWRTCYILYKKWKCTPAVRSKISSILIFASCAWYSDRAHYELCILIKDIDRRLPLQLHIL